MSGVVEVGRFAGGSILSIVCITYQRYRLLEECIQSYLEQDYQGPSEMVVVNDSPLVSYSLPSQIGNTSTWAGKAGWTKQIAIINHPTRFPNIGRKLEYAFNQCQGTHVYRIDDDDLLMPNALTETAKMIEARPYADVVRSSNFHLFGNNKYERLSDGINNGNVFSRSYLQRVVWPDTSADEDLSLVFKDGVNQYTAPNTATMIYRWRGDSTHISNHLHLPSEERLNFMPTTESGHIVLNPHFDHNYYDQIYNSFISSINNDR